MGLTKHIFDRFDHQLLTECTHINTPVPDTFKTQLEEIQSAHLHPLSAGGKRVRPLIVLLLAHALGGERAFKYALNPSLAIELVHTYSLVHDDLPCMDNDDMRRGKPTTHKIYGDAKALLVGDGLLTQAFACLARFPTKNILIFKKALESLSLNSGYGGMILGQWLDISCPTLDISSYEALKTIHTNKTGKLLGAAFELGFLSGLASFECDSYDTHEIESLLQKYSEIGQKLGLVFQIVDDILDVTQQSHVLGKTACKDQEQNKLTAVKILGLEACTQLSTQLTLEALNDLDGCVKSTRNILSSPGKGIKQNLPTESFVYFEELKMFLKNLVSRTN